VTRKEDPLRVFCLEGEWEPDDPADRQSVRPLLQLLEDQGLVESFHRDVATHEELAHYLRRWTEGSLEDYPFAYLAFHGRPGALCLNDDESDPRSAISIERLGDLLKGRCGRRAIHFAACSVLDLDPEAVAAFRKRTGARAVMGYQDDIPWVESAALDLLLLSYIAKGSIQRIDVAVGKLLETNDALAKHLCFVIDPPLG
jgi:hypothetical protein